MPARGFFSDLLTVHSRIRELVLSLEVEPDPAAAPALIEDLVVLLAAHTTAEDQIFLPRLLEVVLVEDERVMLIESHLDHQEIWALAKKLQAAEAGSNEARAVARALNKFLTMHIDEEENALLPMARRLLPYVRFQQLARDVAKRQEELLEVARRTVRDHPGDPVGVLSRVIRYEDDLRQ